MTYEKASEVYRHWCQPPKIWDCDHLITPPSESDCCDQWIVGPKTTIPNTIHHIPWPIKTNRKTVSIYHKWTQQLNYIRQFGLQLAQDEHVDLARRVYKWISNQIKHGRNKIDDSAVAQHTDTWGIRAN